MSHANTYVLGIRDELRAQGFMVSQCVNVQDDPQGDFGIAWYTGIIDGCAQMRYDVGYLPTKHTVIHEFGHDMHSKWQTAGILEGFWTLCGFGLTYEEAYAQGAGLGQYQQWRRTPAEMFADVFAWTVLGDWVQTEMFGVPLTEALRTRLTALFQSFKEEDVALSDTDKNWIQDTVQTAVNSRVGTAEVNILREIMGKLDSGFNTTVATFIDRASAGDKRVATEVVDSR